MHLHKYLLNLNDICVTDTSKILWTGQTVMQIHVNYILTIGIDTQLKMFDWAEG